MNKNKIPWKGMIDSVMFLLLLNQMAYVLTGQPHHERTGTVMVLLILCHNWLNRRWFGALKKGKYSSGRLFGTVVNLLTMAAVSGLFISGVVMSRYVFDFLPIHGGRALARRVHIACVYWAFLLMTVHIGMHWKGIKERMRRAFGKARWEEKKRRAVSAAGWAGAVYGLYAFARHEIFGFLFLQNEFAIFNEQALPAFVLDYLAIVVLFVKLTDCFAGKAGRGAANATKKSIGG